MINFQIITVVNTPSYGKVINSSTNQSNNKETKQKIYRRFYYICLLIEKILYILIMVEALISENKTTNQGCLILNP